MQLSVCRPSVCVRLNTDVEMADEYRHITQWADDNKMIINVTKTKEIVFRRPSPKRFHMSPSVDGIELVAAAKLLGVWIQDNFKIDVAC